MRPLNMDREERRRLLGDEVIAQIRARVAQAPDPSPEVVQALRRIMTRPGGEVPGPAAAIPDRLTSHESGPP